MMERLIGKIVFFVFIMFCTADICTLIHDTIDAGLGLIVAFIFACAFIIWGVMLYYEFLSIKKK